MSDMPLRIQNMDRIEHIHSSEFKEVIENVEKLCVKLLERTGIIEKADILRGNARRKPVLLQFLFITDSGPPLRLQIYFRAFGDEFPAFFSKGFLQRFFIVDVDVDNEAIGVVTYVLRDFHGTEARATHAAEMRDL